MTSRVLHLILNTFVILFLKDGNPITAVWPPTRPLLYITAYKMAARPPRVYKDKGGHAQYNMTNMLKSNLL